MTTTFPMKFGDAGQYELSEEAFRHIVWGDTAVRTVKSADGRDHEVVLSGGLHTYQGWEKFAALHPKIVHLLQFQVGVHDAWYFARELQNGVITLKIPRRLFTKGAAGITRSPDNYYKSGYLWKTLFPTSYTEEDILRAIGEALLNIDREDSTSPTAEQPAAVLYGYASIDDPLASIKVRIQVRGNQIMSAFPAWEQPMTGNNGKAYSHEHSINFQIAESTLDYKKFDVPFGPVFLDNMFSLATLMERTPVFIMERQLRQLAEPIDAYRAARQAAIEKVAEKATSADLDVVDAYLVDFPCAKNPFAVQRLLYDHFLQSLDSTPTVFNAAQVAENVGECLWLLVHCDNKFKTRRAVDAMIRFLGMAIVHTGGLCTLMFKSLLGKMILIARAHHLASAMQEVLAALASSPCRAALYTEFDLNPFVKTNDDFGLMAIGRPKIELELTPEHLLEFIAFSLGENYLMSFSKEERLVIARSGLHRLGIWRMATDVMSRFVGLDFDFFMPDVLDLRGLPTLALPAEDDLLAIMRDYGRMMLMLRQRIILEDPGAYRAEKDFSLRGTQEFFELIRQKHKWALIRIQHQRMLDSALTFADKVGYASLSKACRAAKERFSSEMIPLPKSIPDYIDSWRKKAKAKDLPFDQMLDQMFGSQAST